MKRPVIGVAPLLDTKRDSYWLAPGYMLGLEKAGGLPVMLPLTVDAREIERLMDICDGFVFIGGHDIAPELYGEEPLPECGEVIALRDSMEQALLKLALEKDKSVLGICRGLQMLNVHLGGTLFQDLPSQAPDALQHSQKPPYDQPAHEVGLIPGSPLRELLGADSIGVNSLHHQAVKALAPGLEIMAKAPDGIVEAVYLPEKRFVWAVQWHPEFAYDSDENNSRLFEAFVGSC